MASGPDPERKTAEAETMDFVHDDAVVDRLFEFYQPALKQASKNPNTGASYKMPKSRRGKAQLLNFYLYNPQIVFFWSDIITFAHINIWLDYIKASRFRFAICGPSMKGKTLEGAGLENVPVFAWDEGFEPKGFLQTGRDLASIFFTVNRASNSTFIATLPQYLHVHIHHGDSDKAGSFSRLDALYDHLIVADGNAVDRFRRANIPIPQERFLATGGSVIPGVEVRKERRPIRNILFAPTFEGWSAATNFGSVMRAGDRIADHIAADPARMVVRPHYASGARQPAYKEKVKALAQQSKGSRKGKGDQFNWSDALLVDVSGVLSEYLFTGKPIITPVASDDEWIRAHMKAHGLLKYVYTWDYKKQSLAEFLASIADDPLRAARERRRKKLYLSLESFEESARLFDDVIDLIVLRHKMKRTLASAVFEPAAIAFPDEPDLAALAANIRDGKVTLRETKSSAGNAEWLTPRPFSRLIATRQRHRSRG